jgi:hypothetical protein
MLRTIVASLIALGLLAGCTTLQRSAVDTMKLVFRGKPHVDVTAATVAAKPYAQLRVDSDAGNAVLVLGNIDGDRDAWYSAAKEILFLRDGVLVKTAGLRANIEGTQLPADSPFRTGLQHLQAPTTSTRRVDLPDYRYGVTVTSQLVPAGVEPIDILGTTRRLLRINEHAQAVGLGFAADNSYWVDPATGFVWKSRQTIPGGQTLVLTVLRPYRGAAR